MIYGRVYEPISENCESIPGNGEPIPGNDEPVPGNNPSRPRCLSLPSCAASRASIGAALRRCPASYRPDPRPILAHDFSQPPEAAGHGVRGLAPRHGSDHVDGRPQTLAETRPGQGEAGSSRPPRPFDDADSKGANVADPRRSCLEKDARRCRSSSARWRVRAAAQESACPLLIV